MKTNVQKSTVYTYGGFPAVPNLTPLQQLRRSLLSCLLWENSFYEDGNSIAERIQETAKLVNTQNLVDLAIEARHKQHLRHVPLLILLEIIRRSPGWLAARAIEEVISRPDEMTELLSLYWKGGRKPLSKQLKKGLARAFQNFTPYQLAKYNRDEPVKLRDVLFLCHPKPKTTEQASAWSSLASGTLGPADTWEHALSNNQDKKGAWERLLREGKIGYLALLRNLRNMTQVGVEVSLIHDAIEARKGAQNVLPFRYVAAARACPQMEPYLDQALMKSLNESSFSFSGETIILVDVSASMKDPLSTKSDMNRITAAATLASIWPGPARVLTFSDKLVEVPPRKGIAGVDVILKSQTHRGTNLRQAIQYINEHIKYDRIVVITDEQSTDGKAPDPITKGYMINVASYRNGIGYRKWIHIDGFSEQLINWIREYESVKDQ